MTLGSGWGGGGKGAGLHSALPPSPCPAGLAELAARKYKQAAKCFLLASFDHCDFPEVRDRRPSGAALLLGLRKQGEDSWVTLFIEGTPRSGGWWVVRGAAVTQPRVCCLLGLCLDGQ